MIWPLKDKISAILDKFPRPLTAFDRCVSIIYFILSSEINAYLKQIKMVFSQSETIYQSLVIDISLYFH